MRGSRVSPLHTGCALWTSTTTPSSCARSCAPRGHGLPTFVTVTTGRLSFGLSRCGGRSVPFMLKERWRGYRPRRGHAADTRGERVCMHGDGRGEKPQGAVSTAALARHRRGTVAARRT